MPSIDISRFEKKTNQESAAKDNKNGLTEFLNKDISLGKKELNDKTKEYFYLELGSLLQAGVNLKSSMELVTASQEKRKDKELLQQIQEDIISGSSFSKALDKSGKFSIYEVFSIQIGEESGKLIEVLHDLSLYYKNKVNQRRKIQSALTYPSIVLMTAFGAIFFMLKFVVPMFGDVFKQFGGQLPLITQYIISFSKVVEDYWISGFILTFIIVVTFWRTRKTLRFRQLSSSLIIKIPVVGDLVKKIYMARFCNAMRLLINARLPLIQSISLARQMLGYYPIETTLYNIEEEILKGNSLNQSMKQFKIYPAKMIQLIKVGEETNKLDHFFQVLAEQSMKEIEYQTTALSSLIEPFIMLFLGLIVGLIMIAMYLPMFELSSGFQ